MKTRSTKTLEIIEAAQEFLDPDRPMTLRHLYYLLVSRHVLENSKADYQKLGRVIGEARRRGEISYYSLVDSVRNTIKPSSWSGLQDFTETVSQAYRKDLWTQQEDYIEFWVEKDAIAGVINAITYEYDVCVRPMRGYPSITFLHHAAQALNRITKTIWLYYLGDHDPSGRDIERACRDGLEEFRRFDYLWTRLAINPEDFGSFDIVPLVAKHKDTRYRKFVKEYGTDAAELDALPPDELRHRVESAILDHVDMESWEKLQEIEQQERTSFQAVIAQFGPKPNLD
jgi:hypothetical protein